MIRAVRVARTLADLDQSEAIRSADLALAWSWQAESAAKERGEGTHDDG
jgi:predicted ATPase with chaperone activity